MSKRISYKDVQIMYLTQGIDAVRDAYTKKLFSRKSLRDAVRSFDSRTETLSLVDFLAESSRAKKVTNV